MASESEHASQFVLTSSRMRVIPTEVKQLNKVISNDRTEIAYDKAGRGTALILIDGAMSTRHSNDKQVLVDLLAPHLTVYIYDRRGRGDSGDVQPYAVEREIEDIAALIDESGGDAYLYGHSSGAALAMDATVALDRVKKLAMYEAPYNDDPAAKQRWKNYIEQLTSALAEDRRGDAIALFMQLVGVPNERIAAMRNAPGPMWSGMEAVAPTLAYDHTAILGPEAAVPIEQASKVRVPTIVMSGSASFPFMQETAQALSRAMPQGRFVSVAGQTHEVSMQVLAPILIEFFKK